MNDELAALFRDVADLSPAGRLRYFETHAVSPALRAEVESLLEFDSPDATLVAGLPLNAKDILQLPVSSREGSLCGPYRLLRLLGRGGAAEVFLAERSDGRIEQNVAVKLLGFRAQSNTFRERFLRERQILASLRHPGIAHLLDVGETADGQPYLAMEFIDGVHIDGYAAKLDLRSKLELFLRVCDAVSYAHQNLIIHRDLKPSNILVDSVGNPRLLDFGIAKILDQTTEGTRTLERFLTPGYASPEQVRGRPQSTATDIYSLGAVLYELLTGRSPHTFPAQTPDAIDAAICTTEPLPASTLNPQLPHDLDFILSKALRKEPEERYPSVEAMAADIRAFLEYRPVRARSGNAWYRVRKFTRRYRVLVAASLLTFAGLSAGLYIANSQRILAQQRFQQLHQLSTKIFDLDRDIQTLPGATEARHRLVAASLQYLEGLAPSARGDLDLALEIAEAYRRVGRIQGVPAALNLGEFAKAEQSLSTAASFISRVLAARQTDSRALLTAAGIAHDRMILADSERRDEDAKKHAGDAISYLDRALPSARSASERTDATSVLTNLALFHMNRHRYQEAVAYARRASQLASALPDGQRFIAANLSLIGNSLRCQGRVEEALDAFRQARSIAEARVYPNQTQRALDLYAILLREARTLGQDGGISLNRPDDAIAVYQQAVDITDAAAARDPKDQASRDRLANCARELASLLAERDPIRSLATFDLALRRIREISNNRLARRREAVVLAESSYPLRTLHRLPEARQRIDAAFAILRETKDYPAAKINPESEVVVALRAQADYESDAGDRRRAAGIYDQLFAAMLASKPDPLNDLMDANKVSMMDYFTARAHRRAANLAKAASLDADRLELWKHWDRKLPGNSYVQRQLTQKSD